MKEVPALSNKQYAWSAIHKNLCSTRHHLKYLRYIKSLWLQKASDLLNRDLLWCRPYHSMACLIGEWFCVGLITVTECIYSLLSPGCGLNTPAALITALTYAWCWKQHQPCPLLTRCLKQHCAHCQQGLYWVCLRHGHYLVSFADCVKYSAVKGSSQEHRSSLSTISLMAGGKWAYTCLVTSERGYCYMVLMLSVNRFTV